MAKKTKKTKDELDSLFIDFCTVTSSTFRSIDGMFGVDLHKEVFDCEFDAQEDPSAKLRLRNTFAWQTLKAAYEYAVNGAEPSCIHDGVTSLVIDAAIVLEAVNGNNDQTSLRWENIVAMTDGRYALDDGFEVAAYKLALLANVDLRTIKNAISAGELIANKSSTDDLIYVQNASARRWIEGRKGFMPTVFLEDAETLGIDEIETPASFGKLLRNQQVRIGKIPDELRPITGFPNITYDTLAQLERGVYELPFDAVIPLADFYKLDRKKFLNCVMRVFFSTELHLLNETNHQKSGE